MTIKDSRQRNGSLLLDGVAYSCQPTTVSIDPPDQGDDASDEVLCGDVLTDDDTKSWKLNITVIQDFEDPAGFVNMTWTKQGSKVPFVWKPQGAAGPAYGGTVTVWPVSVGGAIRSRLTSDAEWNIDGKPTRTEHTGT